MKKITLLAVVLTVVSCGLLKAQTNKGRILIGVTSSLSLTGTGSDLMTLGFSTMKVKSDAVGYEEPEPDRTVSLNLLPKIGYFVMDNLAIGLEVNRAFSATTSGSDTYVQTITSSGPFVRYYVPTEKVLPYFEVSGSLGSSENKVESDLWDGYHTESRLLTFGGGFGIAAPLGDKVTFDALLGYNTITVKDKEDNDDNVRTVIGTLGVKLGFTILLGSN